VGTTTTFKHDQVWAKAISGGMPVSSMPEKRPWMAAAA